MAKLTIKFESYCLNVETAYDIKDWGAFLIEVGPILPQIFGPLGNLVNQRRGGLMDNNVNRLMNAIARPAQIGDAPPHQAHNYQLSHIEGEGDTSRQIWVCSGEDCDATMTIHGRLDLESARDVQEVNRNGRENQDLEDGREPGGQAGGDNQGGTASGDRPGEADSGQGQQGEDRNSDRRHEGSGGGPRSERRVNAKSIHRQTEHHERCGGTKPGIDGICRCGCHVPLLTRACQTKNHASCSGCECDCHKEDNNATSEHKSVEPVRESDGQDPDQQAQDEQAHTDSSQ